MIFCNSQITDHRSQITDHRSQITDHRSQITDHPRFFHTFAKLKNLLNFTQPLTLLFTLTLLNADSRGAAKITAYKKQHVEDRKTKATQLSAKLTTARNKDSGSEGIIEKVKTKKTRKASEVTTSIGEINTLI